MEARFIEMRAADTRAMDICWGAGQEGCCQPIARHTESDASLAAPASRPPWTPLPAHCCTLPQAAHALRQRHSRQCGAGRQPSRSPPTVLPKRSRAVLPRSSQKEAERTLLMPMLAAAPMCSPAGGGARGPGGAGVHEMRGRTGIRRALRASCWPARPAAAVAAAAAARCMV